jgi:hypothetical protein
MMIDELLTPDEVCAVLKVRPQTLADWRFYGRELCKHIKIGGLVRYRRDDLLAYLEGAQRSISARN